MAGRICFVYVGATAGGVERVFLNRGEALLGRYPALSIDIYFYDDWGGFATFSRYVRERNLGTRLQVVNTFDPARYDLVLAVDAPRVLAEHPSIAHKVCMECHTAYSENRTYLQKWQFQLRTLIVPSLDFRRVIEAECPGLRGKVKVVRNFVPRPPEAVESLSLPAWRGPLFFYFGRIDHHKNFAEYVEAVCHARNLFANPPLGIVVGPVVPGYPLREVIENNHARGSLVLLPPVPFSKSHRLMRSLRGKRAVFVSCSRGESFGLSAAEAMTAGLPVLLSDIPPHANLAGGRAQFLYPAGDSRELAAKMVFAVEHYDDLSAECAELSRAFSEEAFLADWEELFTADAELASGAAKI
jgi:glycosyltransferase involved in cell wall biosynthesis